MVSMGPKNPTIRVDLTYPHRIKWEAQELKDYLLGASPVGDEFLTLAPGPSLLGWRSPWCQID